MERYLEQLIEDMRQAAKKVPAPDKMWDSVNMNDPGEVEDIAYVEQYLHGTPQKLSEIVGIEKIALPPMYRLSGPQAESLYHEMKCLLEAFHFVPDFPAGLPVDMRYDILREAWDDEHVFVGAGEMHIEFCSYIPAECPFPEEFCTCRQWEEEDNEAPDKEGWDSDDDSLPF